MRGAGLPTQVRREQTQRLAFLLDMPMPRLMDMRPWRCLTCGASFPCQSADVRRVFPKALLSVDRKQKPLWLSGVLLVHLAQKFSEVVNAAAVKRWLLDLYAANAVALGYSEQHLLGALCCLPRLRALRGALRRALASYLPNLVLHIQRSAHVYSGAAIKGDGNFKLAARIIGQGAVSLCDIIH